MKIIHATIEYEDGTHDTWSGDATPSDTIREAIVELRTKLWNLDAEEYSETYIDEKLTLLIEELGL